MKTHQKSLLCQTTKLRRDCVKRGLVTVWAMGSLEAILPIVEKHKTRYKRAGWGGSGGVFLELWAPAWSWALFQTVKDEARKKHWIERLRNDEEALALVLAHAKLLGNPNDLSFLMNLDSGSLLS